MGRLILTRGTNLPGFFKSARRNAAKPNTRYQMGTKSFSYDELMSGKIVRKKLEALANAGKLNEETLARIGHVGRFYQRISRACPNPSLKISDVLTGDELQEFWNETADEGARSGRCPLLH
jgi:hypothetical protein